MGGHPGRHEGGVHEPRVNCGPREAGWFKTFSTYLDEFVNLAGDMYPDAQARASAAAAASARAEASASAQTPTEGANTTGNNPPSDANNLHIQYLKDIGRTVAQILDPLGIDVDFEVRPKAADESANKETQANATPASAGASTSNVNVPQNEPSAPPAKQTLQNETPIFDVDDSSSSSDDSVASFSENQGKSEGWTLLNTDEPMKG